MAAKTPRVLVQVGCYLRLDQAEERGFVMLALGFKHWIFEEEGLHCLFVDAADAEAATAELERFEEERNAERQEMALAYAKEQASPRISNTRSLSLFVFTWAMCFFFGLQWHEGAWWKELGAADSSAILHGEAWRVVTALTLHADLGHLFANLATGIVFGWALLPMLGSGWTWLGVVLSGALGNALNALLHRGGAHLSIGASTAVFGGLGLLVGWQVTAAIAPCGGEPQPRWRSREIVLPFAAGLALLAYLGVGNGNDNVDIMAHGLGMLAGCGLGALLSLLRLPERTTPPLQTALALAALALPAAAWLWALAGQRGN